MATHTCKTWWPYLLATLFGYTYSLSSLAILLALLLAILIGDTELFYLLAILFGYTYGLYRLAKLTGYNLLATMSGYVDWLNLLLAILLGYTYWLSFLAILSSFSCWFHLFWLSLLAKTY